MTACNLFKTMLKRCGDYCVGIVGRKLAHTVISRYVLLSLYQKSGAVFVIVKKHNQKEMGYLFTSESVSEGHPDKVADQISDAVLDELLAYDPNSKVACETLVTTGQVVVAGEVKSSATVDLQKIVRNTIKRIGYTKAEYKFEAESCGIFSAIHEQSADINRGVDRQDPNE